MKKINAAMPTFNEVLGDVIFNFPNDFVWPPESVIREAVHLAKGASEITFAGYGVVTVHTVKGRHEYEFVLDPKYARLTGNEGTLRGVW